MSPKLNLSLIPPNLSDDHINEKIVCIRAHRERIFQISAQETDGKYIFHNYGHGGAGWTFLFGCVNEAIRQFESHNHAKAKPICVIGAGCYGLLTAILLARKGYSVRIVAKEIDTIPSYKAAGFFFPRPRKCSTIQERTTFSALGMESYATYLTIINDTHPFINTGAQLLPCYYGLDIDPGFSEYCAQGLMAAPKKVTINFGNAKSYDVMEYTTIFINAVTMMQELHRAVAALGISIAQQEINAFSQISESIIFNCSGRGAKKLTQDPRIVPVQGHLITLKHQPIEQLQYMVNVKVVMTDSNGRTKDELIYFAPKDEGILGITFIRGQDSETANQHEFDRLLQRCRDFFRN